MKKYYSLAETAKIIGISRQGLHKAIMRKRIKARKDKIFGLYYFIESDIDKIKEVIKKS